MKKWITKWKNWKFKYGTARFARATKAVHKNEEQEVLEINLGEGQNFEK